MSFFARSLKVDYLNGLVGYWRFDEKSGNVAIDSSGKGRHGGLVSAPIRTTGINGGALKLSGINYVSCGTGLTAADLSDKTVSVWINPSSLNQYGIVDKDFDSGAPNYGGWGLWLQTNGKPWWWAESGFDLKDSGTLSAATNTWTHILVTWSSVTKTANFYINGILNSSQTNASIVEKASGAADFEIGAMRNGTFGFTGLIDEVRVYNRVLANYEISNLYRIK